MNNQLAENYHKRSPWAWIPTAYVAEGLPYFAVNTLTVLMYTNMGIGKTEMAFYTGALYLPWVIKPFWSPFVDIFKTKRLWTIWMELLIAVMMAAVAFVLPFGFFFGGSLAALWLMAFFSATHDIAADGYYMLELNRSEQAAYVGVRSTFYRLASILGQGAVVMLAGWLETRLGNVPRAWSYTFLSLSCVMLAISLWHTRFMPRAADDKPMTGKSAGDILRDFGDTFVTFFAKPHIVTALCFILLYRLPEALCLKLVQPFLIDSRAMGGLGLTTAEVGFVNGTVGVASLLAGGIVGGLAIARGGLRKWLWPMALSLGLPCLLYCWLAAYQPESFVSICVAIGIEQFGYGFGFTAFMMYMIYFCDGPQRTSHYAFCTAFMALGMMGPGMAAGWIFDRLNDLFTPDTAAGDSCTPLGYVTFFSVVMVTCIATFIVTEMVRRKVKKEK